MEIAAGFPLSVLINASCSAREVQPRSSCLKVTGCSGASWL